MPRVISFIVLLAIVLLVSVVFFQVMAQFLVPMFLACVLLVVFQPLHNRILNRLPHHSHIAALITTVVILLVVLLPLVWLGWNAIQELRAVVPTSHIVVIEAGTRQDDAAPAPSPAPTTTKDADAPTANPAAANEKNAVQPNAKFSDRLNVFAFKIRDRIRDFTSTRVDFDDGDVKEFVGQAQSFVTGKAISGVQSVLGILFGLAIMVIALYYFLADGPAMIDTVMELSPLDSRYEQELLERFGDISRAVVVATLLSALVQGALAGIGYYFALPSSAPIFLLTAVTMVSALVPFVGAAAVWVCVCGWIYLFGEHTVAAQLVQGDPRTAIILAIYCIVFVSCVDNLIKPFILHGQSNLHPLLALLSILGGVQVLGPVGILVGPMLVSFLQALLNMLRKELDSFNDTSPGGMTLAPATAGASAAVTSQPGGDNADNPAGSAQQSASAQAAAKPARKKRRR